MPENTLKESLLLGADGTRLRIHSYRGDLYVTAGRDMLTAEPSRSAGPFTAADLHAAVDNVAPDATRQPTLTAQRDRARKALESEQARSQELLDRARAAERAKVELQEQLRQAEQERDALLTLLDERTEERAELQGQLESKAAAYDQLREVTRSLEQAAQRLRAERDELQQAVTELAQGGEATAQERAAERPQPRTREDVTDREVETVMRAMGWWQEGKRIGQYPVNLVRSARRAVVALANMPIQERAEVDAIKAWLTTCTSPTTLARELHARGFTAPGGES